VWRIECEEVGVLVGLVVAKETCVCCEVGWKHLC
jgi:hypothetical protein